MLGECPAFHPLFMHVLLPLPCCPLPSSPDRVSCSSSCIAPGLLLLANEVPDIHTVMSWVDFGTLGLLFGMMLIVGQVGDLTWEGCDDRRGWREGRPAWCMHGNYNSA